MTTYVVFCHYYGALLGQAAVFESHEKACKHMRDQLEEELELLREEGYEERRLNDGYVLGDDYAQVDDVWWDIREVEI